MDSLSLSNNDTPSFPGNHSNDSDDNLSSNTLGPAEDFQETNADVSIAPSVPETISDKLSTGVIGDDQPYFDFIHVGDHDEENIVPKLPPKSLQDRLSKKSEAAGQTKNSARKAPIKMKPLSKQKVASSELESKLINHRPITAPEHPCRKEKQSEPPLSSRSCPSSSLNSRKVNFKNVGLLKQNITGPSSKSRRNVAPNDVTLLQKKLVRQLELNKELNLELQRCQIHMRDAASAYADLGKLAIMERERAETAEKKLKEALKRVKELEKAKPQPSSLISDCDAAINSFIDGPASTLGGESLDKIEQSLKSVLNELVRLRHRKDDEESHTTAGPVLSVSKPKSDKMQPLKSQNQPISKARSSNQSNSKSVRSSVPATSSAPNASDISENDRCFELRKMVQHLIAKRVEGLPNRP